MSVPIKIESEPIVPLEQGSEPKKEEIKNNPLTFVPGGKFDQNIVVPEDTIKLAREVRNLEAELELFYERLKVRKSTEENYPGIPAIIYVGNKEVSEKNINT